MPKVKKDTWMSASICYSFGIYPLPHGTTCKMICPENPNHCRLKKNHISVPIISSQPPSNPWRTLAVEIVCSSSHVTLPFMLPSETPKDIKINPQTLP